MMQKRIFTGSIILMLIVFFQSSCIWDNKKPGRAYMPDMAYSVAYETYSQNPLFPDGMTSRKPVPGTIPMYRGMVGSDNFYMPYHFSNTPAGYDSAGINLTNPIPNTLPNLGEGKRLFGIYCAICHGFKGNGDGNIVVNPAIQNHFPPPPSYYSENLINLPEGKIFHVTEYGKNLMPSYATQLDASQRWKVIHYVKFLQTTYKDSIAKLPPQKATASADTTKKK